MRQQLKLCILLAMIAGPACRLQAKSLVVLTSGETIPAKEVKQEAGQVTYMPERGGKARTFKQDKIHAILPMPERGKTYTPDQVEAIVKQVRIAKARMPSLIRKLNALEQQWEATLKPVDPAIGKAIDDIVARIKEAPQDPRTYKKAQYDLQMMAYQDPAGHFSDKIDKALEDMRDAYLGVSMRELEEKASAETITIPELDEIKRMIIKVLKAEEAKTEKKMAKEALLKARATTLKTYSDKTMAFFNKYKTIDTYQWGIEQYKDLEKKVAREDKDRAYIQARRDEMFDVIKAKYKDHTFDERNFPLGKKAQQALAAYKPYSSTHKVEKISEECYAFPVRLVSKIFFENRCALPLMMVFNKFQDRGREYSIVVLAGDGDGKTIKRQFGVGHLKIREAQTGLFFSLDFGKFPSGSKPLEDDDGSHILLYICTKDKTDKEIPADEGWMPISHACRIPVNLPEVEEE